MWSLARDMINTCFWKLKLEVWVFSCMPSIIISCMTGVLLKCCVDVIEKQHWIAEWTENHFSQQCQHGISGNTLTNPRLIVFPGVYVCRRQTRLIQSQSPLNPIPSFLQVTVLEFFLPVTVSNYTHVKRWDVTFIHSSTPMGFSYTAVEVSA